MITLHGFASSNYYNVVKHVLLYKDIPFVERLIYGGDDEWLAVSPVGKIPALTTEDGRHLSETVVICDYLEEVYPQQPLYPEDPGDKATVRQIMKVAELYLELPSRSMIAYAFSGKEAPEAVKQNARHVTQRGVGAMNRLCRFSPWIAGEDMTLADIYVHYVNSVVHGIGSRLLQWDIVAEIDGMKQWSRDMRNSDIARRIEADRVANEPEFTAYIKDYMVKTGRAQGSAEHN
ncbi:MAG: glutathione S-transferase family protein [Halioglobus sp.]|nr:glutathione S-transferase family protein [Halioglobus sp.]